MAFIAIGFCVSRRRNATKSSKCLLNKWIGSHKNAVSHTKKRSFQVPLLPQRVRIFEFVIDCLGQTFNKRNLNVNYTILLLICGNVNLHKNLVI